MNSLILAQSAPTAGGMMPTLFVFGAMFAIMYFVMIRPQQKQQKSHMELLAALKKGDEVILSSGIIGRIFIVEDQFVTLEIGDKVKIKVVKNAVQALTSSSATPTTSEQTRS